MLEISGLTGGWGATTIIEDLSLAIGAGETVAIIGRNGVGKTTLLELLTGRADRRAGRIALGGTALEHRPIHTRARAGIGYVPQQREVFPSLSVAENLSVAARPGPWNAARIFELFPSLAHRRGHAGGQLSGGEQQMLAIGRALMGNPRLLLMDEPSEGLAPVVVEQLVLALRELAGGGALSILLVEQRADVALDLAQRCLVMERGRIIHDGPSAELRDNPELLGRLIGLEA